MDGETAQRLGARTALVEKLSSVPSTHVGGLTTSCNSSPNISNTSVLQGQRHTCAHTYIHMHNSKQEK